MIMDNVVFVTSPCLAAHERHLYRSMSQRCPNRCNVLLLVDKDTKKARHLRQSLQNSMDSTEQQYCGECSAFLLTNKLSQVGETDCPKYSRLLSQTLRTRCPQHLGQNVAQSKLLRRKRRGLASRVATRLPL